MKPLTGEEERRLVQRLKRRDERAFTLLVRTYQTPVFNIALRMMGGSREDALDISQEIFVTIFRAISGFRGDSKLSTWIYRIAVNHCRNRIKYLARRKQAQHQQWDERLDSGDTGASETFRTSIPRPDAIFEGQQAQKFLQEALHNLETDQREVVVLRDIQGLSYESIVEITGHRLGTVKSRLHRGRTVLAKAYAEWKSGHSAKENAP